MTGESSALKVHRGTNVLDAGYALAEAAGQLVIAAEGQLTNERRAVLKTLKDWRDAAALSSITEAVDG